MISSRSKQVILDLIENKIAVMTIADREASRTLVWLCQAKREIEQLPPPEYHRSTTR